MVPPAIWLPILRSPPMSAVRHRVHRQRLQVLLVTVVTNHRRHQQQCHSPYPVFPTSSLIRQVQKLPRTHLPLILNSRIMCRPPDLEWNATLKATIKIVSLFAGLLASGYRSHLILTNNLRKRFIDLWFHPILHPTFRGTLLLATFSFFLFFPAQISV